MAFRRAVLGALAVCLIIALAAPAAFAKEAAAKVKVLTGVKCASKFGVGCVTCSTSACLSCAKTYVYHSGSRTTKKACSCKSGYKATSTGTCVVLATPKKAANPANKPTAKKTTAKKPTAKKPTAKKPTAKKPTAKKATIKPKTTGPPIDANVADAKAVAAKALSKNCSGPAVGQMKFTILKGTYAFPDAAAACKKAGLKLVDLDTIYAGSTDARKKAAEATAAKCVSLRQQFWFDTSLSKPQCDAFMYAPQPTDGTAGRRLQASPSILFTQTVAGGCKTKLPVMCMAA